MRKTLIAGAVALCLGTAETATALTVNVTSMIFASTPIDVLSGDFSDTGDFGLLTMGTYFGRNSELDAVAFFGMQGTPLNWAGVNPFGTPFSYDFELTGNQVAWGTFWNWTDDIPILVVMDCPPGTTGSACAGTSHPIAPGFSFGGQTIGFTGALTEGNIPSSGTVPVPPSAWLMASGLVGLSSIARKRRIVSR